jgi:hypothetical protein
MGMGSTEKLVTALEAVGAPASLVERAKKNAFHDFRSPSATPIIDLVNECERFGLNGVAILARRGEFDATREEADEWLETDEAKSILRDITSQARSNES